MKRLKRFLFGYSVDFIAGGILYRRSGVHGWEFSQRLYRDGEPFEVVYFLGRNDVKACVRLDYLTAIGGDLTEHPDFFKRPWTNKATLPTFPSFTP